MNDDRQADIREAMESVKSEASDGAEVGSGQDSGGDAQGVEQDRKPAAGAAVSGGGAGHDGDSARGASKRPGETGDRARDDGGRFVKERKGVLGKETSATPTPKASVPTVTADPAKATQTATEAPKPAESTASVKPPQSLRPSFREQAEWSKLPPSWQQEITRWEATVKSGLQKAAEAEKATAPLREAVAQFEPMMRAQGLDPVKATIGLHQMWGALNTAPAPEKANIIVGLARRFGVEPELVRQAFGVQQPQFRPQPTQQHDPEQLVDQIIAKRLEAAEAARIEREIEEFGAKHEFFEDVRGDMGAMAAVLEQRGIALDYEDLYNKAIALHPEISDIVKQREAAKAAATAQATTQRQKAAATSIRSQPAASPHKAEPESRREAIAEAFRAAQRQ